MQGAALETLNKRVGRREFISKTGTAGATVILLGGLGDLVFRTSAMSRNAIDESEKIFPLPSTEVLAESDKIINDSHVIFDQAVGQNGESGIQSLSSQIDVAKVQQAVQVKNSVPVITANRVKYRQEVLSSENFEASYWGDMAAIGIGFLTLLSKLPSKRSNENI